MNTDKYTPASTNLPISTQKLHVQNYLDQAKTLESENIKFVEDINRIRTVNHRRIIEALRYRKALFEAPVVPVEVPAPVPVPPSAFLSSLETLQLAPDALNAIKLLISQSPIFSPAPSSSPPVMAPPSEPHPDETMYSKRSLEADFDSAADAADNDGGWTETPQFIPSIAVPARNMQSEDEAELIEVPRQKRIRGRVAGAEAEAVAAADATPCMPAEIDPHDAPMIFAPPTPKVKSPRGPSRASRSRARSVTKSRSHSKSRSRSNSKPRARPAKATKGHPASVKRTQKKDAAKK